MTAPVLSMYRRMIRWPAGRWLFARAVCFRVPYFGTISPRFITLEPGRCEAQLADRRRVHNHLGTVHAIALCNLAELCAGMMSEASLPPSMRWIPKGMTVEYLKKARGTMHAVATPDVPIVESATGYDLPITVPVLDPQGEEVFRARIVMWLTPKASGS
jgi:acyl-coenzyme A thioesterase PaaI-like protein